MPMRKGSKSAIVFACCLLAMPTCVKLLDGFHAENMESALVMGALLGALHVAVRPILRVVSIPLGCLTLGLIQPLIENSIKYGFRKKMDICIRVEGHVEHGILCIRVSDDGLGMDEEEAKTLQQRLLTFDNSARSIGLRNLSRRLYLKYGSRSGLQIRNTPGVGFAVDVHIEQTADRNAKEAEHV